MKIAAPAVLTALLLAACGSDRKPSGMQTPIDPPDCATCRPMGPEQTCYPHGCTFGETLECWDALSMCVSDTSEDEAACWRTCERTRDWPEAPYLDFADIVECLGGCTTEEIECLKAATSSGAVQLCGQRGGECGVACER